MSYPERKNLVRACPSPEPLLPWHAVHTRSNCERITAAGLQHKGYEQFLPIYRSRRRWSDRVVEIDQPLFPGYVFCRFEACERLPIVTTPGVVSIIGFGIQPAPIPDSEIAAIQAIIRSGLATEPCPFLREGQRIRITRGSLENLEGILVKKKSEWRMIVSVNMLQRSIAVEIDRECITTM
jgi:transcription antitermination factor NusG